MLENNKITLQINYFMGTCWRDVQVVLCCMWGRRANWVTLKVFNNKNTDLSIKFKGMTLPQGYSAIIQIYLLSVG